MTRNTYSWLIRFTDLLTGTKTSLPEKMLRVDQISVIIEALRTCLFVAEAESTLGEDALDVEVDVEVLE